MTLAGLLGLPGPARAQNETVWPRKAVVLREAPGDTSRGLATLPPSTALTRTGTRQGPWVEVRTAQGAVGWLHMFDIGAAQGGASGGGVATGSLRGLTGMFSGNAPGQAVATSTVGIRGLGAQDIANAKPNLAAVGRAEALRVDPNEARRFAAAAHLDAYAVPPLPVPASPAGPGGKPTKTTYPVTTVQ